MRTFLHGGMFLFLLGIPKSGINGSYDNVVFNFLRISQTVFHKTISHHAFDLHFSSDQ